MITKLEISRIVKQFEFLPNNPIKDVPDKMGALIETYYNALKDLSLDLIQSAASAYLASGQFFPTPGNIRERAVDIALLTMGVPTPGEAWGQVTHDFGILHTVRCATGEVLREAVAGKEGGAYWETIENYSDHVNYCPNCYDDRADGWHPAVKKAFEAMGSDAAVFTDNPAADRARFTDGYRVFVEREVLRFSMPADVRGYIEEKQSQLTSGQIKILADTLDARRLTHPSTGEVLE